MSIPLIQEIGRPNVGINYDTANCVFYGDVQAVDDLRPVVPYLVHVHLKDKIGGKKEWNFPARRRRRGRFRSILKILEEEGYKARSASRSSSAACPGRRWPRSTVP